MNWEIKRTRKHATVCFTLRDGHGHLRVVEQWVMTLSCCWVKNLHPSIWLAVSIWLSLETPPPSKLLNQDTRGHADDVTKKLVSRCYLLYSLVYPRTVRERRLHPVAIQQLLRDGQTSILYMFRLLSFQVEQYSFPLLLCFITLPKSSVFHAIC